MSEARGAMYYVKCPNGCTMADYTIGAGTTGDPYRVCPLCGGNGGFAPAPVIPDATGDALMRAREMGRGYRLSDAGSEHACVIWFGDGNRSVAIRDTPFAAITAALEQIETGGPA